MLLNRIVILKSRILFPSRFKNKKPLQSNDRMVIDFDDNAYRLIIHEVTEDDVGTYHCTVINSAGQASSVANLNIESENFWISVMKTEKHDSK